MTLQRKVQFWLIALAVFLLFLYIFRGVLLPFVAGMAIAYLLDPVADRLERIGLSRALAVATIIVLSTLLMIVALFLILPVMAKQVITLAQLLPDIADAIDGFVREGGYQQLLERFGMSTDDIRNSLGTILSTGSKWLVGFATSVLSGGAAILSIISLIVVTPVVATYLLVDWDKMVAAIDGWLPRDHAPTIRQLAKEIDYSVAGFVRGQIMVSTFLGVFYAALLTLVGLDFALLIGAVSGVLSIVPYVGTIVGFASSVGVALYQFWPEWPWILLVAGIFVVGQFIEGNILQPKWIGNSVGLHPVWLMFSLFAFGALFGFVGLMVAVPASAAVGVLTRFALNQYLDSPLFRGHQLRPASAGGGAETSGPDAAPAAADEHTDNAEKPQ